MIQYYSKKIETGFSDARHALLKSCYTELNGLLVATVD